ncbi:MAG: vanadium-dependent haloperoxidase [Candidatus Kapaibacterium sp.]
MQCLKPVFALLLSLALTTSLFAQEDETTWKRPALDFSKPATFVHEWNRLGIEIIKIDGFTPGSAARNYAYANVAAYEAALPGFPECRSMAGQLNGLTPGPQPEKGQKYDWRVAIVSAYQNTLPNLIYRRYISDSAAEAHYAILSDMGVAPDVMERSKAYGKAVAQHIIEWMSKDKFVQIGAKTRYEVPIFPGAWERTPPAFWDPVDPYWNQHRPFIMDSASQFAPVAPPKFSTDPNSEFYKMVMAVYNADKNATQEQRLIAQFWDCNPIHSHFEGHFMYNTRQVSPGGHWISISAIAAEKKGLSMMESLEMYVQVSAALADGFISAWDTKYRYNLIRPVTYIQKYVDSTWLPYIETPPFPEWTSAHSTISAAAAAVLTDRFGDNYEFDDWTEAYLGLPVRTFKSFRDAAMEVTWSRFWGGIHYREACLNGTEKGWQLGEFVIANVKTRK